MKYTILYAREENGDYDGFLSAWFDGTLDTYDTKDQADAEIAERMKKQHSIFFGTAIEIDKP